MNKVKIVLEKEKMIDIIKIKDKMNQEILIKNIAKITKGLPIKVNLLILDLILQIRTI
jgi:hypothetical protein